MRVVEFAGIKDIEFIIIHSGLQHLWNKDADPWLYREIKYIKWVLNN